MSSSRVGRLLMTVAVLMYGAVPPFIDLGPTHLLHPDWTPHSRMHLVWLVATNAALAVLALYLLWFCSGDRIPSADADRVLSIHLPGVLSLCVLGGFFVGAGTHPLYDGALSDPGGMPHTGPVNSNVVAFSVAVLILLVGWILAARGPGGSRK